MFVKQMKLFLALIIIAGAPAFAADRKDVRKIPGITAKDQFSRACVDCHVKQSDGTDLRLSEMMKKWIAGADAKAIADMQKFVPKGTVLKGKHLPIAPSLKDLPAVCIKCHSTKIAPPLAPLMHGIHLARGEDSRFVTMFQGECTHCHKLNRATGVWSIPSGPEK